MGVSARAVLRDVACRAMIDFAKSNESGGERAGEGVQGRGVQGRG